MGTLIRRMVRGWRGLSGGAEVRDDAEGGAGTERNAGRKTLLACSGGADSSALVLGLCAGVSRASERFVVGHVVHDLRPRADALKDRDAAKALAAWIGLKFVEAGVRVRSGASARVRECERARDGGGDERPKRTGEAAGVGRNLEALARTARYRALARMARANGCGFVASAHQVDDAMETVLMRLLRGAGGIGLGGVRASRKIGRGVLLVRPMLAESGGVSRAQSELLCREAGVAHAVDATNADETRLRAYVRGKVSPGLRGARRDAAARVASAGRVLAEAGRVVRARGEEVAARGVEREGEFELSRSVLAEEEPIVIGEVVRIAHERLVGRRGLDRLSQSVLREVAARVRDQSPHARTLVAGGLGVEVLAKKVVMRKR
jgi:tRNA(Ile)-lysidine synthase TilS/MesJ